MSQDPVLVMNPLLPTLENYSKYLKEIDLSRTYSNRGPLVQRLEQQYAEKLGILDHSRVVLCSSATLALQGFMQLSEIDTWHIQSFTFPATVHAGVQSGKHIVLEDINPDTWIISIDSVQASSKVGVVPVLPFGAGFDAKIYKHLDHVLIDAAASIGGAKAWLNEIKESWAAVFSLHATKSFGVGEGGLIVFGSKEKADQFRGWINFGFRGQRESLILGTNAKFSEIQAAVGLAVIDNWHREESEWLQSRALVDQISSNLDIQPVPETLRRGSLISPYWIIYHPDSHVIDAIERDLNQHSIGSRRWWMSGSHNMPAFSRLEKSDLRNTDHVGSRYLGLPFYRQLEASSLRRIEKCLQQNLS